YVQTKFTKARRWLFRHLREADSIWGKRDHNAGMLVCRRMDEFCRLAPYFGAIETDGDQKVLKVWDDSIGKLGAVVEVLVEQERSNIGWPTKWDGFERLGRKAIDRLSQEQRTKVKAIAQRLKPQVLEQMRAAVASSGSGGPASAKSATTPT